MHAMINDQALITIRTWVGRSFDEMKCWELIVQANRLRGRALPAQYGEALELRMFRTVTEPEPWDIVPICEHELQIVTHVALILENVAEYIHSCKGSGVVITPLEREPFWSRIATRRIDGKRGYLRLRT